MNPATPPLNTIAFLLRIQQYCLSLLQAAVSGRWLTCLGLHHLYGGKLKNRIMRQPCRPQGLFTQSFQHTCDASKCVSVFRCTFPSQQLSLILPRTLIHK